MPPWPFSTGSPDHAAPPARMPPPLDRHAQTSPVQSPSRYDSNALSELGGVEQSAETSSHPSPKRGHGRSLSGTLPALFGGPKKKAPNNDESLSKSSPTIQDGARGFILPRKMTLSSKTEDGEVDSGHCATCGTKVKWPKGIAQFRCHTCMMVNDLLPIPRNVDRPGLERPGPPNRNGSGRVLGVGHNECPLTTDRTKAIIQNCIEVYLNTRRQGRTSLTKGSVSTPPRSPLRTYAHTETVPSGDELLGSQQSPHRQISSPVDKGSPNLRRYGLVKPIGNTTMNDDRMMISNSNSLNISVVPPLLRSLDERQERQDPFRPLRPVRKPPPPPLDVPSPNLEDAFRTVAIQSPDLSDDVRLENGTHSERPSRKEEVAETVIRPRTIFRALEDYLIRAFGNYQSLNTSFLITRPTPRGPMRSDDVIPRLRSRSDAGRTRPTDGSLSELDAKTLLLGDVAENGLWWTGRDSRTDNHIASHKQERLGSSADSLVHLRSPCINFAEVKQWYGAVMSAGEDWRLLFDPEGEVSAALSDTEAQEIDNDLSEARTHIHRTLLKISEALLKRPGRPLKSPNDIRFLLVLLANPLLDPLRARARATENRPEHQLSVSSLPTEHRTRVTREISKPGALGSQHEGSWDQSHAFGILKRILGLVSNLSNECHRYLTSWFTRYTDSQFRHLVELTQSFITYRVGKQQLRKQGGEITQSGFIPGLAGTSAETAAQIHAALGLPSQPRSTVEKSKHPAYSTDWQIKAAARVMALFFAANKSFQGDVHSEQKGRRVKGQFLSISDFYNTAVDLSDLISDFDTWESGQGRFAFCQYPFFLSVGAKIRIMEHDAHRQMEIKAREAFFNSILRNKMQEQYLTLKVRRDCLVEDSLKGISEVVGTGQQEIKKELKVQFVNEEGVDAGGLRKEWFLLLVREIFEPQHALFVYDEDSHVCYFNPHSFETSDQYFLVGALLGLAIYNSTILDVALPPFTFKKLLASGSMLSNQKAPLNRIPIQYTLEDLAEYRPALANGFRQLLEYDGDVEANLCLDFVAELDRYGSKIQVPLCPDGEKKPVTNANRQEFVDLYVRYLLDTQVSRQFEPFKRGFFTVCGGNALSLFQPEEIELLIRGSDEPLDVPSLKAVAIYENWRRGERKVETPAEQVDLIRWFWEVFEGAEAKDQRKLLGFITGSDRIPAMGAASLVIKIAFAGKDYNRFPIARTCFNLLLLYKYRTREELAEKLWRAVTESEGFGLK